MRASVLTLLALATEQEKERKRTQVSGTTLSGNGIAGLHWDQLSLSLPEHTRPHEHLS